MNSLKIGVDSASGKTFALTIELVTQTIAILARKGKGKSYLAAVFAEELLENGQVPVIIDPTGAHWGLKASADGNRAGYPVVVFGGEHSDVPLEETAGEVVARAIVENRFPAILDLSLLRKGASHRFLAAFLETLYRLNRHPLHLICDEADDYAPQRPFGDEARVLGAMEDIVRRGRIKGIGCTLVTQRPQVINKNVLTQAEMLVTLNMGHPKDIQAIEEWVEVHGDEKKAVAMIASLPALDRGVAWFWAPGWGDIFAKVNVRQRRTFNSGATPKPGETITAPKQLASVDVAKLGKEIAASAQRAKENDPAALKAKIRDLEKQLTTRPATEKVVEIPVLTDADRREIAAIGKQLSDVRPSFAALEARFEILRQAVERRAPKPLATRGAAGTFAVPVRAPAPRPSLAPAGGANGKLPKAERAILICLAQFGACMKPKVAAVAGYAVNGGGFNNALGALRTSGYVTMGEPVDITDEGREALGAFDPLPTGPALVAHWCTKLPRAERMILEVVTAQYPREFSKEELSAETGYEANGGGFNNALGALRTLELITRGPVIKASDNLFA